MAKQVGAGLLCALFCAGLACAPAHADGLRISWVDSNRIARESAPGKAAAGQIESEFVPRMADLDLLDRRVKRGSLSMQEFELKRAEYRADLAQRRKEGFEKLFKQTRETLTKIAPDSNVSLVLWDAVYRGRRMDATNEVLSALDGASGPRLSAIENPVIGYVDVERILKEGRHRNEEARNTLSRADGVVNKLAEANHIDVVVQQAVYRSPALDMTDAVLRGMGVGSGPSGPSLPSRPLKIAHVDVWRMEAESPLIRNAIGKFEKEFGDWGVIASKAEMDKKKTAYLSSAYAIATEAIKRIAESRGIDIVLQKCVYASPDLDLTDALLEELAKAGAADSGAADGAR